MTLRSNDSTFDNGPTNSYGTEIGFAIDVPQVYVWSTMDNQMLKYGLELPSSSVPILNDSNTKIIEMTALTIEEVGSTLEYILGRKVPFNLIKFVKNVSLGNTFWCKTIALYIRDHGEEHLMQSLGSGNKHTQEETFQQILHAFVVSRLEKLSPDDQIVAKYASIIGNEFNLSILNAVLPRKYNGLSNMLEILAETGFITFVEDRLDDKIFRFQNVFIKKIMYNLMPPRYAAKCYIIFKYCLN